MTTTTLPNTGAVVPIPQQRKGPAYASDLVTAFENYDEHDHTTGKGKPIGSAAINIDGDIDFKAIDGHHINNLGALNMRQVTNTILSLSLYTDGEDLFWRDGSGDTVRLTLLHNVNESASGSITGLGVGSSGVSYTPGSLFYTFLNQNGDQASIHQGIPSIFKKNSSSASREMILDFVADDADGASFTKTFNPVTAEVVDQGTTALDFTHATAPGSVTNSHSKIFFDSVDNLPKFQNSSGTVTAFGAGGSADNARTANFASGGDLDTITTNSFASIGVNASFTVNTATPIRGAESAQWVGYESGYTLTYEITIPIPRGYRDTPISFGFKYTGGGNLRFAIIDYTGDTEVGELTSTDLVIPQTDQTRGYTVYNTFEQATTSITSSVTQVRLRWIATGDNPEDNEDPAVDIPFIFDDIVVTSGIGLQVPITEYSYPAAIADNTNEFSAVLDNTSSASSVPIVSQDISFIASATKTATGQITIVFNTDMFSVIPLVDSVPVGPDGTYSDINSDGTQVSNVTATGFNIGYLHQGGGAGGEAHEFRNQGAINITVSRQGADVKTKELVSATTQKLITYQESIAKDLEYTADYVISSGNIELSNISNAKRSGIDSAWISAVNDNGDSGQIDFTFNAVITAFTIAPEIVFTPNNESGVTQGFVENASTSAFRYTGRSLVNGNVSKITQSGTMTVKPIGADVPLPEPSGTFVIANTPSQLLQVDEYPTAGSFTYVVPEDVTMLEIEGAAGGNAGLVGNSPGTVTIGGRGGNAGEYNVKYVTIGALAANRELSITTGAAASDTSISGTGISTATWTGGGGGGGWGSSATLTNGGATNTGPAGPSSSRGGTVGAGSIGGGGEGGFNGRARGGSGGGGGSSHTNTSAGGGGGAGWVDGSNGGDTNGFVAGTAGAGAAGGMVIKAYSAVTRTVHT